MPLLCPACASELTLYPGGIALCPQGDGRAMTRDAVERHLPDWTFKDLDRVMNEGVTTRRFCPLCKQSMYRGPVRTWAHPRAHEGAAPPPYEIDGCIRCSIFWFDAGETDFRPPAPSSGNLVIDYWLRT